MMWSILTGGIMYVAVILATASVMPWEQLVAGHPIWATGTTVRASLGPTGLTLLAVAVATAVATGVNGFYMATSRLLFSMGRVQLLPAWFSRIHPTHGTEGKDMRVKKQAGLSTQASAISVLVEHSELPLATQMQ